MPVMPSMPYTALCLSDTSITGDMAAFMQDVTAARMLWLFLISRSMTRMPPLKARDLPPAVRSAKLRLCPCIVRRRVHTSVQVHSSCISRGTCTVPILYPHGELGSATLRNLFDPGVAYTRITMSMDPARLALLV